jgi:hypothetical protein
MKFTYLIHVRDGEYGQTWKGTELTVHETAGYVTFVNDDGRRMHLLVRSGYLTVEVFPS